MKLKEGEKKFSRGWEYKEIYFKLEQEIEQLTFLEGGNQYESNKGYTLQDFQRKDKNS